MQSQIVLLGKVANNNIHGIPSSLKVWESKWSREVGDVIQFEGEKWVVLCAEYSSEKEAIAHRDWLAKHYVSKGYWRGSVSVKPKF